MIGCAVSGSGLTLYGTGLNNRTRHPLWRGGQAAHRVAACPLFARECPVPCHAIARLS